MRKHTDHLERCRGSGTFDPRIPVLSLPRQLIAQRYDLRSSRFVVGNVNFLSAFTVKDPLADRSYAPSFLAARPLSCKVSVVSGMIARPVVAGDVGG